MPTVAAPSEFALNFYFWFSTITMALTWLIAPLIIYVIFTQSKQLKAFKWFIFNHLFWCLAYQTWAGLIKSILLPPACAGYTIGVMKDSNMRASTYSALFGLLICSNCVMGLATTVACRHVLVFPTRFAKWLNMKKIAYGTIGSMIMSGGGITACYISSLKTEQTSIYALAAEYDYSMTQFFSQKSLAIIPYNYCAYGVKIGFINLVIILIIFLVVILYFITLVKNFNDKTLNTSLQYSLILSSIVELVITCLFLFLPVLAFVSSIVFQISNSTDIVIYLISLLLMHCIIEFIATLYLVKPYKIYICHLFGVISRYVSTK